MVMWRNSGATQGAGNSCKKAGDEDMGLHVVFQSAGHRCVVWQLASEYQDLDPQDDATGALWHWFELSWESTSCTAEDGFVSLGRSLFGWSLNWFTRVIYEVLTIIVIWVLKYSVRAYGSHRAGSFDHRAIGSYGFGVPSWCRRKEVGLVHMLCVNTWINNHLVLLVTAGFSAAVVHRVHIIW